jgi:hypothetical protein
MDRCNGFLPTPLSSAVPSPLCNPSNTRENRLMLDSPRSQSGKSSASPVHLDHLGSREEPQPSNTIAIPSVSPDSTAMPWDPLPPSPADSAYFQHIFPWLYSSASRDGSMRNPWLPVWQTSDQTSDFVSQSSDHPPQARGYGGYGENVHAPLSPILTLPPVIFDADFQLPAMESKLLSPPSPPSSLSVESGLSRTSSSADSGYHTDEKRAFSYSRKGRCRQCRSGWKACGHPGKFLLR